MSNTGTDFVTAALKELGVLDPTAAPTGEQLTDGLAAATDLLDSWRLDRLLVSGITISTYSLVDGQQTYTIGDGGNFNQNYPTHIERWSVIPDGSATDPLELSMGRPLTDDQWQSIRIKTQTGSYPTRLYFDASYAAGLGNILVHPIPDNSLADVKLYAKVPAITSLVATTDYDLTPGMALALKLNLALALGRGRYGGGAFVSPLLIQDAANAKAALKVSNIVPRESPMRSEFAIGWAGGRRTHNIYTDG